MDENEQKHEREIIALIVGAIGLFLVYIVGGGMSDSESLWMQNTSPKIVIVGCCFLILFIFLCISDSRLVRLFGGQIPFTLATSALIWFFYIQSSVFVGNKIGDVFGYPSEVFPNSANVLSIVFLFLMLKPFFWVLFTYSTLIFIYFIIPFRQDSKKLKTLFLGLSGFILAALALGLIQNHFDDDLLEKKTYLLTTQLDFMSNLNCSGLNKDVRGIFLDPAYSKVLIDPSETPEMSWVQILFSNEVELFYFEQPAAFKVATCNELTNA